MSRLPASSNPTEGDAAATPSEPVEMGIGSAAALGLIGAAAGLGFTILRSKVTAVILGPEGFGKAAQILQLVTVANLPATMVTGAALMSSVAEASKRGDREAIARIVRTAA